MWVTVDKVQDGYKQLQSEETASKIINFIKESENIIAVDLSGSIVVSDAVNIIPFPDVLTRLCLLKTREKSLAYYYQSNIDDNVAQCRAEYNKLIDEVRSGKVIISMSVEPETPSAAQGSINFG